MASSETTVSSLLCLLHRRVMPICLREVLGDVQDIIEDAAQKDSYIAKTHKRLSTRLGFNVSANEYFRPCASNTHLEIRFSSNKLFS